MKRQRPHLVFLVVGLLTAFLAWSESYVYNENGRLASGLLYLETGDYSSFHVNPPIVSLIGALPAALGGAACPTRTELGIASFARDEYRAGTLFVEKNPANRHYLLAGRLCCIVFSLIGLYAAFRFAGVIFGGASAVIFLLICAFFPQMLGMTALIVPDVPSAVWGAASVFLFWRWLQTPKSANAFFAGCILGLAELTKFTLLVFYPLFALVSLFYQTPQKSTKIQLSFRQRLTQLALLFGVSFLVINLGYAFEGTGKQLRSFKFQTALASGCKRLDEVPVGGGNRFDGSGNFFETVLGYLPTPLPQNFIQGIDTQRLDFENGMASYLRGEWSDHGWPYYYLYALLVKTPVGVLLLFLLAVFCTFFLKGYNAYWRDEAVVLLPGVVLLAFVSSQTGFSIHSRYSLPATPFFFIWTSKLGVAFSGIAQVETDEFSKHTTYPQGYKTIRVLTVVFLVWSLLSSLSVYPHSVSYFNELAAIIPTQKIDERPQIPLMRKSRDFHAQCKEIISLGSRNGPRHLLDSNVDWGQDLFNLERFCKRRPEIEKIKVAYWGTYPINLTSIPFDGFPDNEPSPGWFAVSVNHLYSRQGEYRYFLDFIPVDMVGLSVYIYHITQEDVNKFKSKE